MTAGSVGAFVGDETTGSIFQTAKRVCVSVVEARLRCCTKSRHTPPPGLAFGEPMDADAAMRLLTEERLEAAS